MAAVGAQAQVHALYGRHDVPTATTSTTKTGSVQHTPPHSVGSSSVSPVSSGPTSPQSTHVALPSRRSLEHQQRPVQLGRPKAAGFVPAALRPIERPRSTAQEGHIRTVQNRSRTQAQSRSGPPSPPQSLHGSTDSLPLPGQSGRRAGAMSSSDTLTPASNRSSAPAPPPLDTQGARPGTAQSPSALHSPTTSLSSLSLTGLASAASNIPHPTKAHWKPDSMASTCDTATCPVNFSTFTRRHHCRRCGGVFCYRHASRQIPLDQDARMVATPAPSSADSSGLPGTPQTSFPGNAVNWTFDGAAALKSDNSPSVSGEESPQMRSDVGMWRACDGCHAEWRHWVEGLHEAAENAMTSAGVNSATEGGFGSHKLHLPVHAGMPDGLRKGSLASSIPRDWSWSTF